MPLSKEERPLKSGKKTFCFCLNWPQWPSHFFCCCCRKYRAAQWRIERHEAKQQLNMEVLKEHMKDTFECVLHCNGRMVVLCRQVSRRRLAFVGVESISFTVFSCFWCLFKQFTNTASLLWSDSNSWMTIMTIWTDCLILCCSTADLSWSTEYFLRVSVTSRHQRAF